MSSEILLRTFQIVTVRFQHSRRILFRISISQEKEIFVRIYILPGDFRSFGLKMEMAVESVVYGNQLFVGQVQSIKDTLTFKLGNCNDFLAFGEYAGHYQAAVMPSHLLI